jgi:hypothetical protein
LPVTPRGKNRYQTAIRNCATKMRYETALRNSTSGRRGSNPRPSAWEADALPTELLPRSFRIGGCEVTELSYSRTQNIATRLRYKEPSQNFATRLRICRAFLSRFIVAPLCSAVLRPYEPLVGIEPTTARLRIECSTPELQWLSRLCGEYGADRDRTGDLCSAIAALSQLSYSPETCA